MLHHPVHLPEDISRDRESWHLVNPLETRASFPLKKKHLPFLFPSSLFEEPCLCLVPLLETTTLVLTGHCADTPPDACLSVSLCLWWAARDKKSTTVCLFLFVCLRRSRWGDLRWRPPRELGLYRLVGSDILTPFFQVPAFVWSLPYFHFHFQSLVTKLVTFSPQWRPCIEHLHCPLKVLCVKTVIV